MALSGTVKTALAIGIVIALMVPAALFVPHKTPIQERNENPPILPEPEQPSAPLANQVGWEEYTGQGGEWETPINQSLFTRNVTMEQLRVLAGEEAERALNGSASPSPPGSYGAGLAEDASGAVDQSKSSDNSAPREVEEADIVKLAGHYLYVLNPYRGLMIVDLADKDKPVVAGAARVQGYPEEMYIVGNLSFIILSANYGYWYNYYSLAVMDSSAGPITGGLEVTTGTHIAVVNLRDKAAPRVVMNI
ncbi:MAG: beta-propeller domain-containing protein, partial [Pseudomonadota bacterium]